MLDRIFNELFTDANITDILNFDYLPIEQPVDDHLSFQSEPSLTTNHSTPEANSLEVIQVTKSRKRPRRDPRDSVSTEMGNAECIDIDNDVQNQALGPVQSAVELSSVFSLEKDTNLCHITLPQLKQFSIQSKLESDA